MTSEITCRWWIFPSCRKQATHLTLACCAEGHIRERLLCQTHCNQFTKHIEQHNCYCTQCPNPLERWLTKTPIQETWDLTQAIQDTQAINTAFGEETQTITQINVTPTMGDFLKHLKNTPDTTISDHYQQQKYNEQKYQQALNRRIRDLRKKSD